MEKQTFYVNGVKVTVRKGLNTRHRVTCYKCGRSEVISMPKGVTEAVCPNCI